MTLWTVFHQIPLSMGFSWQEYWSGLPRCPAGNVSDPGMEPTSPMSSAFVDGFCTAKPPWGSPSQVFRTL